MGQQPADGGQTISGLLERLLAEVAAEGASFGQLIDRLGNRAHGLVILVFALPCTVPMPYGIPTVCGAAILLISAQLLVAPSRALWMPEAIRRRRLSRDRIERFAGRALPLLRRVERFSHRRLDWATGSLGRGVVAVFCAICGITLLLPIPFIGNIPPAIAAVIMAAGFIQRDGLIMVAGFAAFALAMAILAIAWMAIGTAL